MLIDLLRGRDWEELSHECETQFGVEINSDELAKLLGPFFNEHPIPIDITDPRMWFKNRLISCGVLVAGCKGILPGQIFVPLHIGFLHLNETPEMLARLAEKPSLEEESKVARSKVFKTAQILRPIDRVALRVANPEVLPNS